MSQSSSPCYMGSCQMAYYFVFLAERENLSQELTCVNLRTDAPEGALDDKGILVEHLSEGQKQSPLDLLSCLDGQNRRNVPLPLSDP